MGKPALRLFPSSDISTGTDHYIANTIAALKSPDSNSCKTLEAFYISHLSFLIISLSISLPDLPVLSLISPKSMFTGAYNIADHKSK